MKGLKYFYGIAFLLFLSIATQAQGVIMGRVTAGLSEDDPLDNIMMETSSGATAFTNKSGVFTIKYQPHDTLRFYYQGKRTVSYLVDTISHERFFVPLFMVRNRVMEGAKSRFNPALLPAVDTSYNNVTVRNNRSYSQDSLARREEYGDAFNYTKPKMKYGKDWTPVSLNVGKLYETLNGSKKKKNQMLKDNLIREEQEGYITNRFNTTFVRKYLGEKVSEKVLEDYMRKARPKFEEVQGMSDLELIDYIKRTYALYKTSKK